MLPDRTVLFIAALIAGCGDGGGASPIDAGSGDAEPCVVQIASHAELPSPHIDRAAYDDAVYTSNPPSSGPHCSTWGDFRAYERPLPRCNWIHNLEHGGVVLTWNCPNGCPEIAGELAKIARGAVDVCAPARVLVTPDPASPAVVAAAAWGWTFRASCLDAAARAALADFVDARVGRGPEQVCGGGGATP